MPNYEYSCIECDVLKKIFRSINDQEIFPSCPKCGYLMTRVWNFQGGVHFKGSGFYTTDKSR
jgi:putative FmdB family regulatory protein